MSSIALFFPKLLFLFTLRGAEYSQDVHVVILTVVTNHLPGQHFYLQSQCLSLNQNCTHCCQIPAEADSQEEQCSSLLLFALTSL